MKALKPIVQRLSNRKLFNSCRMLSSSGGDFAGRLDLGAIAAQFGNEQQQATNSNEPSNYDLIVIGGGSGGLACAKEAARHGASVALFDYVSPSPQGSTWGLGGTCVNVGCIPKKLFHHASNIGTMLRDAPKYGWSGTSSPAHSWDTLVSTVQDHIKSLNFGYNVSLGTPINRTTGAPNPVTFHHAKARLGSTPGHVLFSRPDLDDAADSTATARHIVLAVGGRPSLPAIPGARELGITSDDLFTLARPPGRTLVVGGSYVALECAGALAGLGLDVTVCVRSRPLKGDGFDAQAVGKVMALLEAFGTEVRHGLAPTELARDGEAIAVRLESAEGQVVSETFDTVLFATGREPDLGGLNLEGPGVRRRGGKVAVGLEEGLTATATEFATTAPGLYCVGDAADTGAPELTPVAIRQGELLARALFGDGSSLAKWESAISASLMVPSTVFTPVEYGRIGLGEQSARERFGSENVEAFLTEWQSLEVAAAHRQFSGRKGEVVDMPLGCFAKLVCLKHQDNKVIGFHYVGPHAGEVLQGASVAISMGATKEQFDTATVGIHPTDAESMVDISVSRSSGEDWVVSGGCGGGKCG